MTQEDLNDLVWPAMRYALGRKTYVVESVTECLIRNAKNIPSNMRYRMGEEIANAINRNEAGMHIDIDQWEKVLKAFREISSEIQTRLR